MLLAEYWRLILIVSLGGVVGFLFGDITFGMLVGMSIYLVRHLIYIKKLAKWLAEPKSNIEPPEGNGIWFGIFNRIYKLQKRNKSQKVKLAAALTRFQEAASAMPDAMVILTSEGKIEWFNQAAKRLIGLKSPQDIEQHITNLIRYPAFKEFVENDLDAERDMEILSPFDESLILQLRIAPYGKGKALLVARDITQVSRLEQVRRHFVANISHELRTPLTVLTGYMETLTSNKNSKDNPWFQPMQHMYAQSNRMQGIVKDLLLLTRLENYSESVVGAEVAVPELIEMLLEEARMLGHDKTQALTADYDSSLRIIGRREDIQSAFSNLVSNAVRYTPKGGRIHIKWFSDDSGAHFVVEDTGMGISSMDIPRLTERFFRVDEARSRETGGTGLGLAIVKHVLQRHDGNLTINSILGRGSQFSCNFPPERIVKADEIKPAIDHAG
ncbi:MAG: phosphate regulon sensor histidine kinase PhoR [Gammaproteobacteria bacterium]|nr:phosphate regulon sensor histidine kinase PhoR [Gammaproteobacteria bacterium]